MPTIIRETREGFGTPTGQPGRFLIQLIDAGEGSSADYPAAALEAAARDRIFPASTHMYLDHAGANRRGPMGERSLLDLAAVLVEDARWNPETQALEAEVLANSVYAPLLAEIKDNIGVSIQAWADVEKPKPGQRLPVVRRFTGAESVDFVSKAGRGGKILAVLEAAGVLTEATASDRNNQLDRAIADAYADEANNVYAWVRDYDDDRGLVWFRMSDALYEQSYTVADDDLSVTLTGEAVEVTAVTTYVPVNSGGVTTPTEEASMSDELKEQVAKLETQLAEATNRAQEAEARAAEADRREKVTEAQRLVTAKIAEASKGENPSLVARITPAILATITEAGEIPADIDSTVTEAIKAEKAYLTSITEGKLVGFGASEPVGESTKPRTRSPFGRPLTTA